MNIHAIDPRDIAWEESEPIFRVHFWSAFQPTDDLLDRGRSWHSEEFEITSADVDDVLAWAKETSGRRRTFVLYVVAKCGREMGLVRLAGTDPTGEEQ